VSLELDAVHDQIAELSAFGSVARGEDRPDSDVDLLYVSASDSKNSLWDLWDLRDELAQLLGRKIDLVPKDSLHWVIRDHVLTDARPVYTAWQPPLPRRDRGGDRPDLPLARRSRRGRMGQ
jgi:predicted nucleotidyltransferase